jgi:anionic cell wall polymer biosynthesis LytR-Cps2A-Psr (LCP) family protein
MAKRKIKRITRKPRKKRKVFKRVVIFLIVFGLLYCGLQAYRIGDSLLASLNAVERTELGDTDDDLMINDGVSEALADTDITNIALFGVDARPGETSSRSDTILILSINNETGDITLTSILRDTYLKIPGHYYTRINAAYAIGGAELAVQTINRNFDMNIKDYITVDFSAIADIVNAMAA